MQTSRWVVKTKFVKMNFDEIKTFCNIPLVNHTALLSMLSTSYPYITVFTMINFLQLLCIFLQYMIVPKKDIYQYKTKRTQMLLHQACSWYDQSPCRSSQVHNTQIKWRMTNKSFYRQYSSPQFCILVSALLQVWPEATIPT